MRCKKNVITFLTEDSTVRKLINISKIQPNHRSLLFRKKKVNYIYEFGPTFTPLPNAFKTQPIFSSKGVLMTKKRDKTI